MSTIAVPIRAALAPIAAQVDRGVPARFEGKEQERGIDIRYEVAREPIRLSMIGSSLHATTTMKYALEACRGRFPCISCGFGEARRIADIRLQTRLAWDPSWRIRSTTRVLPVDYARKCEVTWLDIDITRRFVAPVVEEQLRSVAKTIDANVPKQTNIRPVAEQVWSALQTPAELAPRTWLVLDPVDVALTPIGGSGSNVTSTLVLQAQTRVVIGNKPAATRKPLPALKSGAAAAPAAGVRIPFHLELPYDEASALATRDYAKKTYQIDGKPLTIDSIRLMPSTNGRVIIEAAVDYRGGALRNYKGLITLEGTPRFDTATSAIVIPDLEYSLASRRGFLARIAERAAHDSIRQRLRESARFSLGPRMKEVRQEVTRALNRSLAPGVTLRGRADTIEPAEVTPLANKIVVRVVMTGSAEVLVSS